MEMPINDAGIELLEEFESFVGHAYPDPYSPLGKALRAAGLWRKYLKKPILRVDLPAHMRDLSGAPWTIGYGFTKGVEEDDRMPRIEANHRLATELQGYVQVVEDACTIPPNENQLAAMVCLAWNIGQGWDPSKPKPKGAKDGFRQSTVLRCHNRADFQAASRAFGLWNKADGEESPGLTRRRAAEAALYLKPAGTVLEEAEPLPMPQAVEPESKMTSSPIVLASGASTAVAALTTISETSASIKAIRENLGLGELGDVAPYAIGAMVLFGAYVVWQRLKQRSKGWA